MAVALLVVAGCEGPSDPGDAAGDAGTGDAPANDAGAADASAVDGGSEDAGSDAGIPDPCEDGPVSGPQRIFFLGNSFTLTADLPSLFERLALAGGFTPSLVDSRAVGGQTLQGHRADTRAEGGPARIAEGWDVVELPRPPLDPELTVRGRGRPRV